jgi:hypothetical protein
MFILMLLVYEGFLPPLVCSAPGAESNSAGGAETKTRRAENFLRALRARFCPPDFFSAPAKINPAHATA